jgi:predicted transcriptional regulator
MMNWVETMALLKEAGYSQARLAELCNCSQSTICEIGTGKNPNPRYSIGQKLAELSTKAKRQLAKKAVAQ